MKAFEVNFCKNECSVGVLFVLEACHDNKDNYLFSISAPQHIAAHDVDDVWFWVDFAHEAAKPPPEPV